ncbi:pyridoxal phosphate-dependent aminotransferase [Candidatus Aerophobetes bacterium]|nr:pyridoxal phosphate-dependent aminotransferase [Candidatus Aerophobetes bacterium]
MQVSKRVSAVTASVTLTISSKAKKMKKEGKRIIDFSAGEPDFNTPEPAQKAAIKAIEENYTRYTPVAGSEELIKAISSKFKEDNNLTYSPSQIVVANGAKQIIFNALQVVCNPGDEVILPLPYWVSYPEQIRLAGAVPVYIELEFDKGLKIDAEQLKKAIHPEKTKAIILNTPHNPTGGMFEKKELEKIAEVVEDFSILIISDEIYEDFVYEIPHVSFASLGDSVYKKTLSVNGVSKTYGMTGWRIGYAGGSEELIRAMTKFQSHSTSCASSISQRAALGALTSFNKQDINHLIKEFFQRRKIIKENLKKIKGVKVNKPQGAFYIFPDFSDFLGASYEKKEIKNSIDLADYLLEEAGIAVVPGSAFGLEGYLRISYAVSTEEIKEGIEKMKYALDKLRR